MSKSNEIIKSFNNLKRMNLNLDLQIALSEYLYKNNFVVWVKLYTLDKDLYAAWLYSLRRDRYILSDKEIAEIISYSDKRFDMWKFKNAIKHKMFKLSNIMLDDIDIREQMFKMIIESGNVQLITKALRKYKNITSNTIDNGILTLMTNRAPTCYIIIKMLLEYFNPNEEVVEDDGWGSFHASSLFGANRTYPLIDSINKAVQARDWKAFKLLMPVVVDRVPIHDKEFINTMRDAIGFAVASNEIEIVEWLVNKATQRNMRLNYANAISSAVYNLNVYMVQFLIDNDPGNRNYNFAIDSHLYQFDREKLVKLYNETNNSEIGAYIDLIDKTYQRILTIIYENNTGPPFYTTGILRAVSYNDMPTIEFLLNKILDSPNIDLYSLRNIIERLAGNGNLKILEFIIDTLTVHNIVANIYYNAAINAAASKNHFEVVKYLVGLELKLQEAGHNRHEDRTFMNMMIVPVFDSSYINNMDYKIAISYAAKNNNFDMVRFLVANDKGDHDYTHTIQDLRNNNGSVAIRNFLEEHLNL